MRRRVEKEIYVYTTEIKNFLRTRGREGATLVELRSAIAVSHEMCGTQMGTTLTETPIIEAGLAELVADGQVSKETGDSPHPRYYLND